MYFLIDILVTFLMYALFYIGLWLIVTPLLAPYFKQFIQARKFRKEIKNINKKRDSQLFNHIGMVLHAVYGTKTRFNIMLFLNISFGSGFLTILILINRHFGLLFSVVFGLFVGFLPYIYLRLRLRNIRVVGSYEAETLITELINQYKICNFNMIETIDKTIPFLSSSPYSRRALFKLSFSLKHYRTDYELEQAIDNYVFSSDTEWATLLGMNIMAAISDGVNVSTALEDILKRLKSAKELLEKDRRDNNESFFIIRFFAPGIYLLSAYATMKYFGFTLSKFLYYQFYTFIGIRLALITFSIMVLNFFLLHLLSKPKYDF